MFVLMGQLFKYQTERDGCWLFKLSGGRDLVYKAAKSSGRSSFRVFFSIFPIEYFLHHRISSISPREPYNLVSLEYLHECPFTFNGNL